MKSEQISSLTSLLSTLVATSATFIGFIFVVYTYVMINRKESRSGRKDKKDEGYIMFVTLFNLAIPLLLALHFMNSFTFNFVKLSEKGITEIGYFTLYYLLFIAVTLMIVNSVTFLGSKKYGLVKLISLSIIIVTVLTIISNVISFGIFKISLVYLIILMIFIMIVTVLQTWIFLALKDHYRE
ncbi:hypothetical protein [Paenibacillus sp. FSL K6-0108]|uniref:hypothetical protein n=1 Tax=Paenibacillus sp. FSL K6-0108 TaxID=2921417 RepID=UPI003249C489